MTPYVDGRRLPSLEGGDIEDLVTTGPFSLMGIALDLRVPGDCDGDGIVNLADLDSFIDCMTGPDTGFSVGCSCADLDFDGSVDLADFAAFQVAFAGP